MSIKPERNRVKQTKKEGGIEIGVPRDQHLLLKTSNQIHTDWNLVLAPISPNEGLSSLHCVHGLVGCVTLGDLAVDDNTAGPSDGAAAVKEALESLVTLGVPVTDDEPVLILGIWVWNWDQQPAEHSQATDFTSNSLKANGGEVEVGTDMVLHLKLGLV
ncbi:hypothetical protein S83_039350 [Arachis hypogaea]